MPAISRNHPPLRLDRAFLDDPANQLKLAQMGTGILSMVFTANCWPNEQFPFCWSDDTLSFFQLFTEVSVNGFFLVMTTMFAVASLFSVPDAYYHYNFPMLEKFYVALATVMYLLATFISFINFIQAPFVPVWILQVTFISLAFFTYFLDFWRRWKTDKSSPGEVQVQSGTHMHTVVNPRV